MKAAISLSTYNIDIINKFKGEIYMSHKCKCKSNCGSEGICGISPCCILIGIVAIGFLLCGRDRC